MTNLPVFDFRLPTSITNGPGSSKLVGEKTRALGLERVLVVTDRGVRGAGLLDGIEASLRAAGVAFELYDEVESDPSIETVERGAERYRAAAAQGLVAVGGGSPIDTAKAIGILIGNGGRIADYEGVEVPKNPSPPLVALPTTAGTGSEVTPAAIISDHTRRTKMNVASQFNRPRVAIGDPLLTLGLPPGPTAASGMDALTHAMEAYTSKLASPHTDALALYATRAIGRALPRVIRDGGDLEARSAMLMASQIAGLAFASAGLGIVHALDHPLTAYYRIPHGVANAILLPHAIEFNHEWAVERYADLAEALDVPRDGRSPAAVALAAAERVRELTETVGLPTSLRAAGARDDEVDAMARDATQSRLLQINPRPLSVDDAVGIYQRAMDG